MPNAGGGPGLSWLEQCATQCRRIENSISVLGSGCDLPRLEGLRSEGAERPAVDEGRWMLKVLETRAT
jgi:hypothetical protein